MIVARSNALSQAASAAYGRIGQSVGGDLGGAGNVAPAASDTSSFGASLESALQGAIDTGHTADVQTQAALNGQGNITDVVTAVSKAQMALQTTTVIRDRVVQAYQDIMRMSI